MVRSAALVLVGLAGCAVGAGPVVGYGKRGVIVGAEATAGTWFPAQVAVGFQAPDTRGYLRFDAILVPTDDSDRFRDGVIAGFRAGGGFHLDGRGGGMFAAGLGGAYALQARERCDQLATIGVMWLEARYSRGWYVVASPRLERHGSAPLCGTH